MRDVIRVTDETTLAEIDGLLARFAPTRHATAEAEDRYDALLGERAGRSRGE